MLSPEHDEKRRQVRRSIERSDIIDAAIHAGDAISRLFEKTAAYNQSECRPVGEPLFDADPNDELTAALRRLREIATKIQGMK